MATNDPYNPYQGLQPPPYQSGIGMPYYGMPLQSFNPNNVGYGQNIQALQSGQYLYPTSNGTQAPTFQTPSASVGGGSVADAVNTTSSMAGAIPYGSLALGGIQTVAGLIALRQASKLKLPQYQLTGNMAQGVQQGMDMRNQGFTNSELGAYEQGLGNQTSNTFRKAKELSGGQGASAIYAMLNGHNVDARNQIALGDASLHRQNIAESNRQNQEEQQLKNMNTAQDIDQYNRTKQAAAGLLQSGIGNIANPMNYFGGLGLK